MPDTLEHIRTWTAGDFRLELFDTHRTDHYGKAVLSFALYDATQEHPHEPVFAGSDYCPSPLHAIDSDESVAGLLGFLSLKKGDTDSEYFDGYTPAQLDWRDRRAEDLSMYAYDLDPAQ